MKKFRRFSWIVPLILFLGHQVTQRLLEISMPFIDNYLDPFSLGALSLYGVQLERKWLFGVERLSWLDIFLVTIYVIVVSEILFPYFSKNFISDWADVISILMGMSWFIFSSLKSSPRIST